MMTDAEITSLFGDVPRERQEINFVIPPLRAWGVITRVTTYVLDVAVTNDVEIEAIDPNIIRGRHIEISYLKGSEDRARALAHLVKRSQPLGAFYVTPKGDWVQLVDGHWKVLVRMPNEQ